MSILLICLIFVAAFVVSLLRGVAWAFVAVYLPALILFNQLPEIPIPHAPLAVQFAPLYAILLAIPFRPEPMRFRLCSVDVIMILLLISAAITAWTTEIFETGINTLRTDFFTLTGPYLLARICFKDWKIRRGALNVLIGVLAVLSLSALVEFRLSPYFYLHVLQSLGMNNKIEDMAYERYGFFRVSGSVGHPIYFGNMCLVILGMVAVLARTSGLSLKNGWVATALFAAAGCVVTSISGTPMIGMCVGCGYLLILVSMPFARKLILPLTLAVIAAMIFITYRVGTQPLGEKPEGEAAGSLWTREMIVHESWNKASEAGLFGLGIRADLSGDADFDLKSVDNTYMQFTLTHGFVYTGLWISIAIVFSWRMTRAYLAVSHPSQIFPLAVCTATVLGLMISMYTVWAGAGALYTTVWVIMLGLSNTLIDSVLFTSAVQPAVLAGQYRRSMPQPSPGFAPAYAQQLHGQQGLRLTDG